MKVNIIENDKLVDDPIRYLNDNFVLEEEDEKMFIKYCIDDKKEIRIFFKDILLTDKEEFKRVWELGGEPLKIFFESIWIVKSNKSGVLIFVPEKTEMSDKDGEFLFVFTDKYHPSPSIYLKRSNINNNKWSVALYYMKNKNPIFIMGKSDITMIMIDSNKFVLKKYKEERYND